ITDRRNDPVPGASGNYAAVGSVTDDTVFEQSHYQYNASDRLELVTNLKRRHETTSLGAITYTSAVPTYQTFVYDEAKRRIATIDHGTRSSSDFFEMGNAAPTVATTIPGTYPSDQLISVAAYNERGLADYMLDPALKSTKYFYDDLGRRIAVVENYDDATIAWNGTTLQWDASNVGHSSGPLNDSTDRVTSFVYDGSGNVTKQVAHLPSSGVQVTQYVYDYNAAYGTTTVGSNSVMTDSLIASNDLLYKVRYPDESTGAPGTGAAYTVSYAYNRGGELRSTTDQNTTRHVYTRDSLGRVTKDHVDAFGTNIDNTVKAIAVTYDSLSRLDQVRSASDTSAATIVNDLRFRYTPLWQVAKVYQDHDGVVETTSSDPDGTPINNTARVQYTYANDAAKNYSRLTAMTYPDGTPLNYKYGTATLMDDRISRVESLSFGTGTSPTLVSYARVGLDMVAGVDYPTPDVQLDRTYDGLGRRRYVGWQLAPLGSYAGWDRFGRVKRQSWLDGTLTRKTGSTTLPNKPPIIETIHGFDAASNRLNAYDDRDGAKIVDRDWAYQYDGLDRLKEAQRGGYNGSTLITAAGSQQWALDMLGNWATVATDLNGNGTYDALSSEVEIRNHNEANELEDRDPDGSVTTLPAVPFTYDNAGNMRQQNKSSTTAHVYTHDAWNRLVKVQLDSVPSSTPITLNESEYNGLHWRTVKKTDTTSVPNGLDQKRVMYYSAAWQMIQEDIDHSYLTSPGTNDRAQQVWGLRYIDDAAARRTDTGANGSYESTYYYITDAQFSVVAILNSTGVLQERVRYDAYGKARHSWPSDVDGDGDSDTTDSTTITGAYGTIGATAYNADCDINRSGTVDATDLGLWIAKTALPAGEISHLPDNSVGYDGYLFNKEFQVYTVRFRHYEPVLGRWLKRDPAGYVDGMSAYQFVGGRPTTSLDPMGLEGQPIWDDRNGIPTPSYGKCLQNLEDDTKRCSKERCENIVRRAKELAAGYQSLQQRRNKISGPGARCELDIINQYDSIAREAWNALDKAFHDNECGKYNFFASIASPDLRDRTAKTLDNALTQLDHSISEGLQSDTALFEMLAGEGAFRVGAKCLAAAGKRLTQVELRHYTSTEIGGHIRRAKCVRTDAWVTTESAFRRRFPNGATPVEIEDFLEIDPGKGQECFFLTMRRSNLWVPAEGPKTSGGAIQYRLKVPCPIE
ncbi:MAG: hypothetical protein H7Y88_05355, partial [Phycisphaerales bacterium]|nr:hypothetical protein [Phycisphaerales bacterium]